MAAIWQEVLGADSVGINDNFFDMGGSSLLIVEAQSRLEAEFGKAISVAEVFNRPTIAELSKYFSDEGETALELEAISERTNKRRRFAANRERGQRRSALRRD